jgi:hypothetical protein
VANHSLPPGIVSVTKNDLLLWGQKSTEFKLSGFDIQIEKTCTLRVSAIPRMNWVEDENLDYKRM